MLGRSKIDIQRHETSGKKRIDRARRFNGQLRVKFHRTLQIAQSLFEQCRHLLQPRCRGDGAIAWRVVFLFQQRKNAAHAFAHVNLRVRLVRFQDTISEIDILELGAEKKRVDAVVFRPIVNLEAAHFLEQRMDVLRALRDFRGGIITQLVVPGVQTGLAAAHRIVFISPGVIIVRQFVQLRRLRTQTLVRNRARADARFFLRNQRLV